MKQAANGAMLMQLFSAYFQQNKRQILQLEFSLFAKTSIDMTSANYLFHQQRPQV